MGLKDIILVILYLIIAVSAAPPHEPQVREELDEHPPPYVRRTRHLDGEVKNYEPLLFNYHKIVQQDRLKSRYHRQQQADFRNLKIAPKNPDASFGLRQYVDVKRGTSKSIPFDDSSNDWKPFQPKFLNTLVKHLKAASPNQKKRLSETAKEKDTLKQANAYYKNDLDLAGSDNQEEQIKSDRQYIYITPSILKNNFGLDSKTTEQILHNSAPENVEPDKFQITELEELVGKNPSFQLQGLQKLLEETKPIIENNLPTTSQTEISSGIQINHNGSPPSLEALQQQIDAVNKAKEHEILAAAQKQAEAHVQAQHRAIALAQKQSHEEALAKIAAHNQGISTLSPSDGHLEGVDRVTAAPLVVQQSHQETQVVNPSGSGEQDIDQNVLGLQQQQQRGEPEISALQGRPLEEVLVHPARLYTQSYAPTAQDLRNNKPRIEGARGRFYHPALINRPPIENPKLQYFSPVPPLYNSNKEVHNYSPVSPYTPHLVSANEVDVPKAIPEPIIIKPTLPGLQEQIEPATANDKQLYEGEHAQYDDVHQYAAKYAFGYRILDEEHGNDFGHEEERNGKLTKGHYFARLPDGRKQRVEYYADNSGYHARVSYENVGVHPYNLRQKEERHVDQLQPVHK